MADQILTAVLGNLSYNDTDYCWALEVGQYQGCYELYSLPAHDAADPKVIQDRENIPREINRIFQDRGMPYQVPPIPVGGIAESARISHSTIDVIKGLAGQRQCAIMLIGQTCAFLREGVRILSKEQEAEYRPIITSVARSRLAEIELRCPDITLSVGPFWELLSKRSLEDLATPAIRKLLADLQKAMTVLVISASPQDLAKLGLGNERREIDSALRRTKFRDRYQILEVPSCRTRDISESLFEHKPTIIHFSGHGSRTGLCFEDDRGKTQIVRQQSLAEVFKVHQSVKVVIMNACYSSSQAQTIADAVGWVISMDTAIQDRDAVNFARELYTALGFGKSIELAFASATAAAGLEITSTLRPKLLKGRTGDQLYALLPEEKPKKSFSIDRLTEGAADIPFRSIFNFFCIACLVFSMWIMMSNGISKLET